MPSYYMPCTLKALSSFYDNTYTYRDYICVSHRSCLLSLLQESGSPMQNIEPGEHLHFHDLNLEAEPLLIVSVNIVSPISLV